jgi:hypothetical protein
VKPNSKIVVPEDAVSLIKATIAIAIAIAIVPRPDIVIKAGITDSLTQQYYRYLI